MVSLYIRVRISSQTKSGFWKLVFGSPVNMIPAEVFGSTFLHNFEVLSCIKINVLCLQVAFWPIDQLSVPHRAKQDGGPFVQ